MRLISQVKKNSEPNVNSKMPFYVKCIDSIFLIIDAPSSITNIKEKKNSTKFSLLIFIF